MKLVRLSFLFVALLLVVGSAASAKLVWDVNLNTQGYIWQATDWVNNTLEIELNWYKPAVLNGHTATDLHKWSLGGQKDGDPIISETVRNFTTDVWSDWHIIVHNGIIRQDGSARIYRSSPAGPDWLLSFGTVPDGTTLTGIAPGPHATVGQYQVLSIYFVFDPTGAGPVSIDEWPTTDYIPEPASLFTLAAGVAGFGLTIRRRLVK